MLLTTILLAISTSIDSLGIGITYGIKNTLISFKGKLVIFFVSFLITLISLYFGSIIRVILPWYISDYLGSFIFIIIGILIFISALKEDKKCVNENTKIFGITTKIIKYATSSDLDNSNKIDSKEALFLSIALSIDSICVGIGTGVIDINNYVFPVLIGFFQIFFLSIGIFLAKQLYKYLNIPNNIWSIISGILLIFLGVLKMLF